MNRIYSLIKHLVDQIGERRFYFIVPSAVDPSISFEIMWVRGDTLPWSFSLHKADNWTPCSTLDILDALTEVECDLEDFSNQVVNKIITQVTYMDMRIKDARKLLGNETVNAGIDAHAEFGKSLMEMINKLLGEKPKEKTTLRLIDSGKDL